MSALPSSLRSALASQLAALDAQLAPTPLRVLPPFKAVPPPEDPTVTVSLRVASQIELALRMAASELAAGARATHGHSEDVAAAHMRASDMQAALDAFAPVIAAAVEENRRRRAEWRRQQGRG